MPIVLPDRLSEEGQRLAFCLRSARHPRPRATAWKRPRLRCGTWTPSCGTGNGILSRLGKKERNADWHYQSPRAVAGFEAYPSYSSEIIHRIQNCLDIANNLKDRQHGARSCRCLEHRGPISRSSCRLACDTQRLPRIQLQDLRYRTRQHLLLDSLTA